MSSKSSSEGNSRGKSLSQKRQKVARNFIKSYGRSRFRELLQGLAEGKSGQVIADDFGVSRERVRQWKNTFGDMVTIYQLHPEIERILNERGR
jgi:DNA-directed RNA polymerase sigma subunit (sigma70/sigma32)